MAYLASGIAAVAAEGEFPREELMHAQMEESDIAVGAVAHVDWSVDAQIHVSVHGRIIMADEEAF